LFFASIGPRGKSRAPQREARDILPRHAFEAALANSLRLLRRIHVPLTLFAVRLPAQGLTEAEAVVGDALSPLGVLGRLPDGRIGLLYLGPRAPDAHGEDALSRHVLAKIEKRLQDRGWGSLCRGVRLYAAHAWADVVSGPAELIAALDYGRVAHPPALTREAERCVLRPSGTADSA
jgi:hypothetical protein